MRLFVRRQARLNELSGFRALCRIKRRKSEQTSQVEQTDKKAACSKAASQIERAIRLLLARREASSNKRM